MEATIACANLFAGRDYTVTAQVARFLHGTSTAVDPIEVEITFAADDVTDEVDYDLPIDSTYDYEITGATIDYAEEAA